MYVYMYACEFVCEELPGFVIYLRSGRSEGGKDDENTKLGEGKEVSS